MAVNRYQKVNEVSFLGDSKMRIIVICMGVMRFCGCCAYYGVDYSYGWTVDGQIIDMESGSPLSPGDFTITLIRDGIVLGEGLPRQPVDSTGRFSEFVPLGFSGETRLLCRGMAIDSGLTPAGRIVVAEPDYAELSVETSEGGRGSTTVPVSSVQIDSRTGHIDLGEVMVLIETP